MDAIVLGSFESLINALLGFSSDYTVILRRVGSGKTNEGGANVP